eukprot:1649813-Prymnesium_polylepis.1
MSFDCGKSVSPAETGSGFGCQILMNSFVWAFPNVAKVDVGEPGVNAAAAARKASIGASGRWAFALAR